MFYASALSSLPGFAADILAKATLLLIAITLIDLCLRHGSAAMRHRVWATAFVCLLLLPVLSIVIPEYRLAILPAGWFSGEPLNAMNAVKLPATQVISPSTSEAFEPISNSIAPFAQNTDSMDVVQLSAIVSTLNEYQPIADTKSTVAPFTVASSESRMAPEWFSAIGVVGLVWTIGWFVAVSPLILGMRRIMLLRCKSPVIVDVEPTNTLAELCRRLRIRRLVRLLETEQSIVPMTWGLLSPIVLVPSAWRDWAIERRRVVLLHELAHVKRLDAVYQSMARVACSLYWFHPLAWYALKRLRIERELACDDCVLMAGERPSHYAEQLLTIAREYQSMEMPPAVAMAQRSGLENRVRAMLDQARSHVPLTPLVASGMLVAAIVVLFLLAPIRLGAIAPFIVDTDSTDDVKIVAQKPEVEQMRISGLVTSADNQPIVGARVTLLRRFVANTSWEVHHEKLLETTTDTEGRYQADVPATSERFSNGYHFEEQRTIVHASKEGYGADEVDVDASKGSPNLQLATASKKIQGRFLDLEGKPMQGVKVKLIKIEKAGTPISIWREQAKNNPAALSDPRMMMAQPIGATNWPRPAFFPSRGEIAALDVHGAIEAVSDSLGTFTMSGVGDDRQATLQIESPSIATAWLHCVTYDMPSVNMPSMDPRFRIGRTFGAQFDYSVEPSQWIQGVVRDKKSGTPLPGIVVSLHQFGDSTLSIENFIQSTTDANGRYVLKGIPKPPEGSNGVNLRVLPSPAQPYFRSEKRVPKSVSLEPIELDMALSRAIWIEGQITDATTKAPLAAMVAYYPSRENRNAENHEKWRLDLFSTGYEDLLPTDGSGRFRVPGLAGPGVLRVVAANDMEYELAEGNLPNVQRPPQKYYHCDSAGNAMAELEIPLNESSHQINVAVNPLKMRSIHVVDSTGNDVVGYQMAGRLPAGRPTIAGRGVGYWGQKSMDIAFANFFPGDGPERERPLMFLDAERKLGAVVPVMSVVDDSDEIACVTLHPTVKLKGKLVDANGKALTQGYVKAGIGLTEFHGMFPTGSGGNAYTTSSHPKYESLGHGSLDEAGNFEMVVPPGKGYSLVILGGQYNAILFRDRELLPGQTLDLGTIDLGTIDVTVAPNNLPVAKVEPSLTKAIKADAKEPVGTQTKKVSPKADEAYLFRGTVVHPDGTPAAGASLHLVYFESGRLPESSIPPVATTDANGAFEFRVASDSQPQFMELVASKPGFGITSGKPAVLFETTGRLVKESVEGIAQRLLGMFGNDRTLRLVSDDQPLSGRILTVDGTPVPNAQIRVNEVWSNNAGKLDGWEKAASHAKADYYSLRNEVGDGLNGFQLPSILPDVTTDAEGRFILSGIGKERIVQLLIGGSTIETTKVFARTRSGKTIRVPHQFGYQQGAIPDEVYYANEFEFVAAPSVPVEGRIVDNTTGEPLVGFFVTGGRQVTFSRSDMATVTDKDGRYRLTGLSQSNDDSLFVVPPRGSRYLPMGIRPKTKDARETVKLDVKLKPTALLNGQVKDAETGKPIPGWIKYFVMTANPNLADHRGFTSSGVHECRTDKEGRFIIAVLPGDGVVTFRADDSPRYRRVVSKKSKIGDRFTSPAEMGMYETVPFIVSPGDFNFAKQLQIEGDVKDTELIIELASGKSLEVSVVNPNGEPVPTAILNGTAESSGWYPSRDGGVTIEGYYADTGRDFFAYDPQSHQAAYVQLTGPQKGEIVVTLKPAGSVRGRIVDKQGVAVSSVRLLCDSIPEDNSGNPALRNTTDKDGKFELRGAVPGYKHTVWALIWGKEMLAIAKDVDVEPTNGLDLGDVVFDIN